MLSTSPAPKQEEFPYDFELQTFDDSLLAYWAHYGIYEETLRRFCVRSLKSYRGQTREGKSFELRASPTEPMFAYIGQGYVKIYRPNSPKMRFLYGGRMPNPYCFGMEQIPSKGDILFITGEKKTCFRYRLIDSMPYASIVRRHSSQRVSLKACNCAFDTSFYSMIQMKQGQDNLLDKLNNLKLTKCSNSSSHSKAVKQKRIFRTTSHWAIQRQTCVNFSISSSPNSIPKP